MVVIGSMRHLRVQFVAVSAIAALNFPHDSNRPVHWSAWPHSRLRLEAKKLSELLRGNENNEETSQRLPAPSPRQQLGISGCERWRMVAITSQSITRSFFAHRTVHEVFRIGYRVRVYDGSLVPIRPLTGS